MRIIFVFMMLLSLKSVSVLAQQSSNSNNRNAFPMSTRRFGIGFYAGINDPFSSLGKVSDIGPSFMLSGSFKISGKWQVAIGAGGVFYYGKSLVYMHSKNVFDTIYTKSYTVTWTAYTYIPVIFKYNLNNSIQLMAGIRWLGVSGIFGTGSYGIYSPAQKDSFIFKSNLIPGLPKGSNFEDIQGLAGLELAFNKHFSESLMANFGFIPIYPNNLSNIISPLIGNYNNSIELGLNYTITP